MFPAARHLRLLFALVALPCALAQAPAQNPPSRYRAINLNGPALLIDGHPWEPGDAPNLEASGNAFENQAVALKPATDPARARMIRSSRWGSKVSVDLLAVPPGDYQLFVYTWEDNHTEQFDLLVNDSPVAQKLHSGNAGSWKRLGPFPAQPRNGRLRVAAHTPGHGAANLSGIEVWSGTGPIPEAAPPRFATAPTPEQVDFFERRIRPVLADHCYECHSARAPKLKGGLVLDSRAGVVRGGDTGPLITPGNPEASLLIQAVRHTDPDLAMPPKSRLPASAVADLEEWVRMGAPDPRTEDTLAASRARSTIDWDKAREWWSFRPVADPAPPATRHAGWALNGLDRFILARLEQAGLEPAPDADRRTWLRRVTFDLTGLPPDPADLDAFLADDSPEAHARVVDRLLDSPAYGERWGRHWLDVVRYADTAGDNSDFPIPQMARYRDWVIDALNRDLPYDQFVREQIAGDLMPSANEAERTGRILATGYIANARRFGSRVDDYPQHLTIEDTLDNLGRAFLGLSLNCARCHDHKFDPIPTEDYYALYGFFGSTRYPWPGIELEQRQRDLVPLVPVARLPEVDAARKARDEEQKLLQKAAQQLRERLKDTPADAKPALEAEIRAADNRVREHTDKPFPFDLAYAVTDASAPTNAAIQIKGDPAKPGPVVPRRFLRILGGHALPADSTGSGRLQLARWITSDTNPLFARVIVNRVWHHHFGRGLVPTPNDFGRQGRPPSHPELLDWLASRFRESGGSLKAFHRLVVLSRTYRQSASRPAAAIAKDPANELLAGFPRRRLDAEAIRDTLLALGGSLDRSRAQPHPFPPPSDWKFTQHNPFRAVYESRHRSVYLMTQRIQRHPFLATFDGADPSASTAARLTSTTPVQALFLLNDPLVHQQALGFAERIARSAPDDPARITQAYRLALGRTPEPAETAEALQFLARVRAQSHDPGAPHPEWQAFARAVLRLNEFVYLD